MANDLVRNFLFVTAAATAFAFVLSIVLLPPATTIVAWLR
jgi:hypothetical protein